MPSTGTGGQVRFGGPSTYPQDPGLEAQSPVTVNDDAYLRLWGKTNRKGGDLLRWHPAAYHCLDVAGCMAALAASRPGVVARQAATLGMDPADVVAAVTFLVGVHDLGKMTRPFLAKVPALWPADLLGPVPGDAPPVRHGEALLRWLRQSRAPGLTPADWPLFDVLADEDAATVRNRLLGAVAGHHGEPVEDANMGPHDRAKLTGPALDALAADFLRDWAAAAPAGRWTCADPRAVDRFAWLLAGWTMLADWLGSDARRYPCLLRAGEVPAMALAAYWEGVALPRGRDAVADAGLLPRKASRATPREVAGVAALRPMQAAAAVADLPDGPLLVTVEDATGSGKSEAALIIAHRLVAAGRAGGLYVGLPTMTTANSMYDRLARTASASFDGVPSLALVHGRAHLDPRFGRVAMPGEAADGSVAASCPEWIRSDRNVAFLADAGAGTLDQPLLGVLPVRAQAVRLAALADRVLVADEVHAYDAYTGTLLAGLVSAQATLGGTTVLLSATLPSRVRADLDRAYRDAVGDDPDAVAEGGDGASAYPLLTVASPGAVRRTRVDACPEATRRVRAARLGSVSEALDVVAAAHAAGRAACYVRNTVADAMSAHAALRDRGVPSILFHARFTLGDRQRVEAEVLRRYGRDATHAERTGYVLVATQVVEQSLNLDLDVLVTDLAPMDLLLQRAGRLWRYAERTASARGMDAPTLHVVSPDPAAAPGRDWLSATLPGTGRVYRDHALLWRSARLLFAAGGFDAPGDVRGLVEAAYADGAEVPPALGGSAHRALSAEGEGRTAASRMALPVADGYVRRGPWLSEDAALTRLSDGGVRFTLAREEGGALVPFDAHPDRRTAWALSEVSARPSILAEAALDARQASMAEALLSGGLRGVRLAVAVTAGDGAWTVRGVLRDGTPVTLAYDAEVGLRR